MVDSYKTLAKDIIDLAKSKGADTVSVSLGNATSYQVETRNQKVDLLKEAGSSGIDISLCKDKRRSSISSNDLRLSVLEPLITSTIQALAFMDRDEDYSLPDSSEQGRAQGELHFVDPNFQTHTAQTKLKQPVELETYAVTKDERISTEHAYYSDMNSYSVYADSNGFIDGYSKTLYSRGISLFVDDSSESGENSARKQTDGWYSCARFYDRLEQMEQTSNRAAERVLRKLGATKPKSQEVPVVFSPEMACSFMGVLSSAMMGDNIYRKNSFLANRLNERIANPMIQLRDDPLIPYQLGSRYFDSEGVLAKPLTLIENGVLKNYMLSTYSANKLGMKTTGHSGGISNLVLEPGSYTNEELIESVSDGLYLTFMSGQGANIGTGDYSRGAQGLWIRDGKLAEPVSEFTIASTFLDILNHISMISNEVDVRSSILAPSFKVDKMAISGA